MAPTDCPRFKRALEMIAPIVGDTTQLEFRALSDGITNVTFRVNRPASPAAPAASWCLRVPGLGTSQFISRQAEAGNLAVVSELGIGARVDFVDPESGVCLSHWEDSKMLTPADVRSARLADTARLLRQLHSSGLKFEGLFDPVQLVDRYSTVMAEAGGELPAEIAATLPESVAQIKQYLATHAAPALVPCHVDPLPSNFLQRNSDKSLVLIDWEYSALSDPAWDLGDLCCEAELDEAQQRSLIAHYGVVDEDPSLAHRVELYRILSDLLWTVWSWMQKALGSTSMADFETYGWGRYRRGMSRLQRLRDQRVMSLPKLVASEGLTESGSPPGTSIIPVC